MKKLVVLTGAGISQESGIETYRDKNGVWNQHDYTDYSTPQAFINNPKKVLKFHDEWRKKIKKAQPNEAHQILAELENQFQITIITQNIDDLHERAGSKTIIHLHGEINKSCSANTFGLVYDVKNDVIKLGEKAQDGFQLRPYVVWFCEAPFCLPEAINATKQADIFLVIGTSLKVYPAAELHLYTSPNCRKIIIDPNAFSLINDRSFEVINDKASSGLRKLKSILGI